MRNWYHSKFVPGLKTVIAHEAASFAVISAAVSILSPRVILETGTACCGLTLLLHESCPSASLYSFDSPHFNEVRWSGFREYGEKCAKKVREVGFVNKRVHFIKDDILLGDGNSDIISILTTPKYPKFVYFDNGNKEKEIELYSKYLEVGDIMGVHDWGKEVRLEKVKDHLAPFIEHPLNFFLIKENCTTRIFIKNDDQ